MQPVTSKHQSPKRSRAWIPLVSLLLAAALAAVMLWLLRVPEPKPAARAARTSGEVHSTYKNRAMIWQSAAKQQRAEQPKISGNVYSGDGMSLAGATILATTFDRAGNTPSTLGTVKSDEQGHFEIPLPDGTYQLNASLAGYGPTAATANSGDTVSLVMSKSGVLRGHVHD